MHYQSSSYETSSYGEFYPSTWPKQNPNKPYINYSITASQSEDWFEGILTSASLYDANNDKALYKLIPAHVLEDGSNEEYVLFTQMIGHYFDILTLYVKQITAPYDRNESTFEGFSRELIYNVANGLGIDFDSGNSLDELWAYTLGADVTGSAASMFDATSEDRTKENWKRIINNLPYLLKTKGTERGVRALINCYGIPQTILRIREYGGAEPDFDSKTDLQYERFNYALQVGWYQGSGSVGYYSGSLYGSDYYGYVPATQTTTIPWTPLIKNQLMPMATQIRAKIAKDQTNDQRILEVPDQWMIKAFKSGSEDHLGFFLNGVSGWATASVPTPIYDENYFHSITIQRDALSDDPLVGQNYKLIVKRVKYDKVVFTHTASLFIQGSDSSSYNQSFTSPGTLWLPGSGSSSDENPATSTLMSGSVQEFRYWATELQNSILDNHALAPTSYQGNTDGISTGSTSSYYDLAFRLCLGSDNRRPNSFGTASIISQHPNQNEVLFYNGAAKIAQLTGPNPTIYLPIVERHSMEWPDLGGNRSVGTKIRIEDTFTAGSSITGGSKQLYRDNSVQRSLSNSQPPDSSRLGIYLSPTNEINQDIAEHFGGISIDDYIGDPGYLRLDHYPGLDALKWEWGRKFIFGRNQTQNYIRLIRHFDSSLFQLIKKFVPYRANTQVGLVIEPSIIERAKVRVSPPTFEELQYDVTLDVGPETVYTLGGAIQDGDGEPSREQPYWANNGYVPEGKIGGDDSDYITLEGDQLEVAEYDIQEGISVLPTLDEELIDYVLIDGTDVDCSPTLISSFANQFNQFGLDDNPSTSGSMAAAVDFGISQYGRDTRVLGSQYVFMTWATSGSGPTTSAPYMVTSSHYSYHEALNPVILDSRFSEISNNGSSYVYDSNIYNNRAFTGPMAFTQSVTLISPVTMKQCLWTSQYGLRLSTSWNDVTIVPYMNSNFQWRLNPIDGLNFYNNTAATSTDITGSVELDAFFFNNTNNYTKEYIYEVSIVVQRTSGITASTLDVFFGSFGSAYTETITPTTTATTYTYTTRADGPRLCFVVSMNETVASNYVMIKKVSARALNYRAQVQDFHLRDSYGMRNARYDGCKLTATDYNVDSPDTIDGGPVIQITLGTGVELTNQPTTRGNFTIR